MQLLWVLFVFELFTSNLLESWLYRLACIAAGAFASLGCIALP
jgi:hypothetical protein